MSNFVTSPPNPSIITQETREHVIAVEFLPDHQTAQQFGENCPALPQGKKKNPLPALTIVKGQQFLMSGNSFALCALLSLRRTSLRTSRCWTGAGMAAEDTVSSPRREGKDSKGRPGAAEKPFLGNCSNT